MLSVKNLKKYYRNKTIKAVDIQELYVQKASVVCLVGASGCGKTTTLKMINCLIEPSEGSIEINGIKSEKTNPILWRRNIGYVIQKIGLFPHLTVFQNISLLSRVLKRDSDWIFNRVNELLDMVGLNPKLYRSRYPVELSGGQRQRVGIARALMADPPLLLMDEPFGSLDPLNSRLLRKEFLNINQKLKKTIVMVTHDLNTAFEMADKVILMQEGSIVQEGSKEDFEKQPQNRFVKDFLNEDS